MDDANIDHEKKMMIEGHFAESRAKHYTDRDVKELRNVYRRAYPFIRLNVIDTVRLERQDSYEKRLACIESRLDEQLGLHAKLTVIEGELIRMKEFRESVEQSII